MDCDTTGIEPDFALVKFKKLAGGGYFKIINQAVPEALRTLGYGEAQIAEIEAYAVGPRHAGAGAGHQPLHAQGQGLHRRGAAQARHRAQDGLRHQVRLQPLDDRRGVPDQDAADPGRDAGRSRLRPARAPGLFQEGHRGGQRARVRGHDAGRRAAHRREAPARVRLRQPLRPQGQALPVGGEPHPHDGGEPALHLGRHLQDHQHAERGDRGGLQAVLHALLAAGAEGQCALPRRLQAVPAAQCAAAGRRRRGAGGGGRAAHRPTSRWRRGRP